VCEEYVWAVSRNGREGDGEGEGEGKRKGEGREGGARVRRPLASSTYACVISRSLLSIAFTFTISFAFGCLVFLPISHGFEQAHPSLPRKPGGKDQGLLT